MLRLFAARLSIANAWSASQRDSAIMDLKIVWPDMQSTLTTKPDHNRIRPVVDTERMKPRPYCVREAVGLLGAGHAECVLVGDSTTDVLAGHLAGVAVIGYADKPGKAQALTDVQAAAVTTDLAEITTALRNTA